MKKNNIIDSFNKLSEQDVYGKILMILYKMKDDEKYSTLSSLIWALDKENLLNFLTIFEGVEIKVPKIYELKLIVGGLQVFQLTQFENKELDDALKEVMTSELSYDDLKDTYFRICHIVNEK